MKKSQLITLVILFVAVSIFIWVGACGDDKSNIADPNATISMNASPTEKREEATATPEPTAKPTQTPITESDYAMLNELSGEQLNVGLDRDTGKLANSETEAALQGYKYSDSRPGGESKDIYISFMLHYSDANSGVEKLLDLAEKENLKFNFFVSSTYIDNAENEETIRKIYNAGHTIGSRGIIQDNYKPHSDTAKNLHDSLLAMNVRLVEIVGENGKLQFYSPETFSQRSIKLANLMGYTAVFRFSQFANDNPSRGETYNGIQYQAFGAGDELIEQLTSYVEWAKSEGYTFKGF